MVEPSVARHGYRMLADGAPIGVVTSGSFGPAVERYIGMGYVPTALRRSAARWT
jgi:aminomethyltransferase